MKCLFLFSVLAACLGAASAQPLSPASGLDTIARQSTKERIPLLAGKAMQTPLQWIDPPKPGASFGMLPAWARIDPADIAGGATLFIPFGHLKLGMIDPATVRVFRFDPKTRKFGKPLETRHLMGHTVAAVDVREPGIYGLIGLNTHPLVQTSIVELCQVSKNVGNLTTGEIDNRHTQICQRILCAPENLDSLRNPGDLPLPGNPGGSLCDQCHGIDVRDFPDCYVHDPVTYQPDCPRNTTTWESLGPRHIAGVIRDFPLIRRTQIVSTPSHPMAASGNWKTLLIIPMVQTAHGSL